MKRRHHQVRHESPTVDALWELYQKKPPRGSMRPRTLREYQRMTKVNISPELGAKKAVDVRPHDLKRR